MTSVDPRSTWKSFVRSLFSGLLLLCLVLPVTADPGPAGATEGLFPGGSTTQVPLVGSSLTASLYRPAAPGSEGVVLVVMPADSLWERVTHSLLDRGVTVLQVPEPAPLPVLHAAYRWLQSDLGDDAIVGTGGEGSSADLAWQLGRSVASGATLLIGARGELEAPAHLLDPNRAETVLLLSSEDDFVSRERARSLYIASPDRVGIWLVDGEGIPWREMLSRRDLASDLAHWWLLALEDARAARRSPMADRVGEP